MTLPPRTAATAAATVAAAVLLVSAGAAGAAPASADRQAAPEKGKSAPHAPTAYDTTGRKVK